MIVETEQVSDNKMIAQALARRSFFIAVNLLNHVAYWFKDYASKEERFTLTQRILPIITSWKKRLSQSPAIDEDMEESAYAMFDVLHFLSTNVKKEDMGKFIDHVKKFKP